MGDGFRVNLENSCLFGFKSEPRKLFVKGLSVSLGNTWELVLELALKTLVCLVKGLSVSLGNTYELVLELSLKTLICLVLRVSQENSLYKV